MSDIKLAVLNKLTPRERGRFYKYGAAVPGAPLGQRLLYALGASVDPFGGEGIAFRANAKDPFLWKKDTWWDLWNIVHDLPWRCASLDLEAMCTVDVCRDYFEWLTREEVSTLEAQSRRLADLLPGVRDVLPG